MPFYANFSNMQPTQTGSRMARKIAKNQIALILKHHASPRHVLELGPGRGPFAEECREKNIPYTCADISVRMLQDLHHLSRRVQAMVPPLPFASESFDVAFAANFLEHMLDFRHAYDLADEMKRVIVPGGLVCHSVPNYIHWGAEFWNGDYTHSFPTTPRRAVQLYADLGFRNVAVYPLSGPWVGLPAHFGNIIGKLIPAWLVNHGAATNSRLTKALYSAKTTFLESFMILGEK